LPLITLTSYDSDDCHCEEECCDDDEKSSDEKCVDENVEVECVVPIVIDVTPPTPPPSVLQCQQNIPMVFVSFDDDEPGKKDKCRSFIALIIP
jgi:hypothetical protein